MSQVGLSLDSQVRTLQVCNESDVHRDSQDEYNRNGRICLVLAALGRRIVVRKVPTPVLQ